MTLNLLFSVAVLVLTLSALAYSCYLSAAARRTERVRTNDVRLRELEADVFSSDIEGVVAAAERRVEDELRPPRTNFIQVGYIRPGAITFGNPAETVRRNDVGQVTFDAPQGTQFYPTCADCGWETLSTLEGYRRWVRTKLCDACAGGLERKNRPSTTDG